MRGLQKLVRCSLAQLAVPIAAGHFSANGYFFIGRRWCAAGSDRRPERRLEAAGRRSCGAFVCHQALHWRRIISGRAPPVEGRAHKAAGRAASQSRRPLVSAESMSHDDGPVTTEAGRSESRPGWRHSALVPARRLTETDGRGDGCARHPLTADTPTLGAIRSSRRAPRTPDCSDNGAVMAASDRCKYDISGSFPVGVYFPAEMKYCSEFATRAFLSSGTKSTSCHI